MRVELFSIAALVLAVIASPSLTRKDEQDWKYAVGWDGVTLPAGAIGEVASSGNGTTLEKRNIGGVYICTDINWGGKCGYAVQPIGECIKLGGDWNHKISSFGPDPCTECNGYDTDNCGKFSDGQAWGPFYNPGDATGGLGTSRPWNDIFSSFECWQIPAGKEGCPA